MTHPPFFRHEPIGRAVSSSGVNAGRRTQQLEPHAEFGIQGYRPSCVQRMAHHERRTQPAQLYLREHHLPPTEAAVSVYGLVFKIETQAYLANRSVPHYSASSLTGWYNSKYPVHIAKVISYYMDRTCLCMELMDAAEICTKNA